MNFSKSKFLVVPMIAMAAFAGSCGKHLSALTDEQKAVVKDTVDSASRAGTAVQKTGASKTAAPVQLQALKQHNLLANWALGALPTSQLPSPDQDRMGSSMQRKLSTSSDTKQCDVTYKVDVPTSAAASASAVTQLQKVKVDVKVAGAACPVAATVAFAASGDQSSLDGSLALTYTVQDTEYRGFNDVDGASINGTIKASGSSDSMTMSLDVSGNIHSQKKGDVVFKVTATADGSMNSNGTSKANSDVTLHLEYTDFVADLRFKTESDGTSTYYVNDGEVTKDEFNKYLTSATNAATSAQSSSQRPAPMPTSLPTGSLK